MYYFKTNCGYAKSVDKIVEGEEISKSEYEKNVPILNFEEEEE